MPDCADANATTSRGLGQHSTMRSSTAGASVSVRVPSFESVEVQRSTESPVVGSSSTAPSPSLSLPSVGSSSKAPSQSLSRGGRRRDAEEPGFDGAEPSQWSRYMSQVVVAMWAVSLALAVRMPSPWSGGGGSSGSTGRVRSGGASARV